VIEQLAAALDAAHDAGLVVPVKRLGTSQAFIEHARQRVDVGAGIPGPGLQALGGHGR